MPAKILDDLTAFVKQHEIGNGPIPIKELEGYEEDLVREFLQERGYVKVEVSAHAQLLGSDTANEWYSLSARISNTQQFWVVDIQFRASDPNHSLLFSPGELRGMIPLDDGALLNVAKIKQGLEALKQFYGSRGYINFVVTPDFHIDEDRQRISIVLELDVGSQFRVGNVEVLGFDTSVESLLRSKLIPGDVYNPQPVDDFFKENESLLPVGASAANSEVVVDDVSNNTVNLVFFRSCPKT